MFIVVKNWRDYQTRTDIKTMNWFRINTDISSSQMLFSLKNSQKWFWICVLTLCARKNSEEIEIDFDYFSRQFGYTKRQITVNLQALEEINLIKIEKTRDGSVTDTRKNVLPKQTNKHTHTRTNTRDESKLKILNDEKLIFEEIISYLNSKLGTSYSHSTKITQRLIKSRLTEGFKIDDFKKVIDSKYAEWIDDSKMCKYLTPNTLFSGKFESYLQTSKNIALTKDDINNEILKTLGLA